jgi:SAM-dependent methyltransferase
VAELGAEATGLDPSPEMLAEARTQLDDASVELDQGVAESLPYEDESFDLVYSFSTLALVADIDVSVREIARVLRPSGIALLDIPGKRNLSQRHWSRWWRDQGHQHYNALTRRDALGALEAAGLRPLEEHALGAVDQLKYLRGADRLPWIERLGMTRDNRPGPDYRLSNVPFVNRLTNRWYIAAVKA